MTSKEKAKKLHEIADALEEWRKYDEKITNTAEWNTAAAKQIIRKAMTLLVNNLVLLNECKNKYGYHNPLQQCFMAIEHAASLPETKDLGDFRSWTRDFTKRHLSGGERRSLAGECVRYANKVNSETEKVAGDGRDNKTTIPGPKKEKGGLELIKKIGLISGILLTILLIIWTSIQIWNHYKEDTSKTPPEQIETPKTETKQIVENKLDLSLRNICGDIDSRPLALQAETEKQYLGLRIKRERLKVLEVEINPGDESIYNLGLTIPDQPTFPNSKWIILCTVSKDQYPQLRGAREGMEFYLSGEIETTFRRDRVPYICLSNVTLEFE